MNLFIFLLLINNSAAKIFASFSNLFSENNVLWLIKYLQMWGCSIACPSSWAYTTFCITLLSDEFAIRYFFLILELYTNIPLIFLCKGYFNVSMFNLFAISSGLLVLYSATNFSIIFLFNYFTSPFFFLYFL